MITNEQLESWTRGLRSRVPLLGARQRRSAVEALAENRDDPRAAPLLAEAVGSSDAGVSAAAVAALSDLNAPAAVDAFCAAWAGSRNEQLAAILVEKPYVASAPLELALLTGLKVGLAVKDPDAQVASGLLTLCADRDAEVSARAGQALRSLPTWAARDALCQMAIRQPAGDVARICLEAGYRPSDQEQACLFLCVTRQADAYFQEDYEFQGLRAAYEHADASVQALVMDVLRSGDRRWLPFFGTGRKELSRCAEVEINLAIDSARRHEDWPRLFRAFLDLPLKHGLPLVDDLRRSGWHPPDPELQSVLTQVLSDTKGGVVPPPQDKPGSSVFERWLASGAQGELAKLPETEIAQRLEKATPPEGVALVGALAGRCQPGSPAANKVLSSPHWLVRLAGHAAGLPGADLAHDRVQDDNYWIGELTEVRGVLEIWPSKATPADLEALSQAPAEAWTGRLGSARKVLRTVLAHRVTTGTWDEMKVEAGEFAAEWEMA